ncbi:hypothetical protein AYO20_00362 [Fonsecaea nubica]|uniref:tRNA(His) guanylyltransferase n=1 Tax=Fonsecaea nubica TaxID=856822 RepID=A0A178DFT3_9EURO|nr:hypothetical protein AYO20_00362 [Fonsecaea nubica]OAL40626.1 hypothetical protein AYO20_00362 [Fonsecaea nubica]
MKNININIDIDIDIGGVNPVPSISRPMFSPRPATLSNPDICRARLSTFYDFRKPNDPRALRLMNHAASHVVASMPEIAVAYGVSDEFSFVFDRVATLFERRRDKLVSTVVSTFTAAYVAGWDLFFGDDDPQGDDAGARARARDGDGATARKKLTMDMLPTFDGRAVCYPSWANLRDYLSWRQVDCHINNLYNTTFWALVQEGGMTPTAAEELLKGTLASDKNEILWSRFGINYNNEPEMYRKGSVVFREYRVEDVPGSQQKGRGTGGGQRQQRKQKQGQEERQEDHQREQQLDREQDREQAEEDDDDEDTQQSAVPEPALSKTQAERLRKARKKATVVTSHVDIIRDEFWVRRPWIRSGRLALISDIDGR